MNNMMYHAADGVLQARLDGELTAAEADRLERHLSACEECGREAALLGAASEVVSGALRLLDAPPARVPSFMRPAAAAPAAAGRGWAALPRAAVLVLSFGALASATIPGSPVRGWLESLLGRDEAVVALDPPAASPTAAPLTGDDTAEAGVSVAPEGNAVRVMIHGAAPGVVVTAVLSDGPRAGVYAAGAATSVRFITGPGRIEVTGMRQGALRVEIPAAVGSATVEVEGARYVLKDGDRLRLVGGDGEVKGNRVTFTLK